MDVFNESIHSVNEWTNIRNVISNERKYIPAMGGQRFAGNVQLKWIPQTLWFFHSICGIHPMGVAVSSTCASIIFPFELIYNEYTMNIYGHRKKKYHLQTDGLKALSISSSESHVQSTVSCIIKASSQLESWGKFSKRFTDHEYELCFINNFPESQFLNIFLYIIFHYYEHYYYGYHNYFQHTTCRQESFCSILCF